MQNNSRCVDSYSTTFDSFPMMLGYHKELSQNSEWTQCPIKELGVEPLDKRSEAFANMDMFAEGVSEEAVEDTAENLGLALRLNGSLYPLRTTAYKSLLDRAKINGTALPKLPRKDLADILNACFNVHKEQRALVLLRGEKATAVHSGDERDYSVLPIDELLETLQSKLDERFPGNEFKEGYSDYSISGATWSMPKQKEDLLGTYSRTLALHGKTSVAKNLVPGIQFITSDTGMASAKVAALLMGDQNPIHIGSCLAVDHRRQMKVVDFEEALDQLFAQFGDNIKKLQKLLDIQLDYPINAMTRICKKLVMPKKEAVEAIAMFEMAFGDGPATAHDVFMGMQEIPYLLKADKAPESKILAVQESMARALNLSWAEYDLAKGVEY